MSPYPNAANGSVLPTQTNLPPMTDIVAELSAGLLANQAQISPKYLYDELGSHLFDAICLLPEYYLTRTEAKIFAHNLADIVRHIGQDACLIEPGAGSCSKAAKLFPALRPKQYVAIDISAEYLEKALSQLRPTAPEIEMLGLGMDFSQQLHLPPAVQHEKRMFFYPGSSIGNFSPEHALQFLQNLRMACSADQASGVLLGFDLPKEKAVLEAAYDDALGLTAAFNLNLLRHVAGKLDMKLDLADWQHRAFFNQQQSRIEMHLQARQASELVWGTHRRQFAAGSSIHTENSYKYSVENMQMLLRDAGFMPQKVWQDEQKWFALMYARAQ